MKHINLDREDEQIKRFVRSLPIDPMGSILELEGHPLLKVLPLENEPVDPEKLKGAILKRRKGSRASNREWDAADREAWDKIPRSPE